MHGWRRSDEAEATVKDPSSYMQRRTAHWRKHGEVFEQANKAVGSTVRSVRTVTFCNARRLFRLPFGAGQDHESTREGDVGEKRVFHRIKARVEILGVKKEFFADACCSSAAVSATHSIAAAMNLGLAHKIGLAYQKTVVTIQIVPEMLSLSP